MWMDILKCLGAVMLVFNSLFLYCACKLAGREDRRMEEELKKKDNKVS